MSQGGSGVSDGVQVDEAWASELPPPAQDLPKPAPIPGRWYVLAVLTAINIFCYMDRMALAILQEPIKAELHLSDSQLGLLSGFAFAAFYGIMGVPLARLADRYSRIKLISVCMVLWSVFTSISGLARNFTQLFVARMGVGVGEAGCLPPGHSLISDYFSRERRTLAITIFQCGGVLGLSGGLFIVGALGQHLGWRTALQIIGLAGIPIAILSMLTLRDPRRSATSAETREPALVALRALLARPALLHLAFAIGLSTICTTGMTQWLPSFLIRSFGLSMVQAGGWSGLSSIVSGLSGLVTGGLLATWLFRRDPRWELWIPAIAFGASAPLFALMILSPTVWMVLVIKAVAYFMGAIGGGVALAAVHSFAEPHRRATAISITYVFTSLLGLGLGPYLIGAFSDLLAPTLGRESLRYALLTTCVMLLWAVVHYLLAARGSQRDRVN